MNKRIKELADQCTEFLEFKTESGHTRQQLRFDKEKFAELIVRECAVVAKQTDADDGDDYKSGRSWAGIDILKHFGVE